MEQANNIANSLLQTMAAMQGNLPKASASTDGTDDFQKLLDEKSQAKDSLVEERPKADAATGKKPDKAPAQKKGDALERAKKLAEQGAWFTQPDVGVVDIDLETGEVFGTYEPGEYILAHLGGQTEIIPTTGMAPWEQAQLQQLMDDGPQAVDVSDPKADAMLEATAPGADNSPAAMLEKVVAEQTGQEIQPDAGETQGQAQDEDGEVELIDVEQAPQQIFHDVKAAPVKVGEAEQPQEAEGPDAAQQLDSQIGLAIARGDSHVTVRLNPENLGEVTVQISVKDNGILSVALNAKNDATRALLDRHSDNLQQLLSSRVRETVEVDVQRQSESQPDQNQQNYDGHNGHAQEDGQERRRRQQEPASSQDFMQQLRLGLIPTDGEL